ncbi:MAG: T9SS type A sorting domain-containing protein [Bacteroidota bacterium]
MTTRNFLLFSISVLLTVVPAAHAESHFSTCSARTGSNATVIVPLATASISGAKLEAGDELAVFTPDGVCAGSATWQNDHAVLVAWRDSPVTAVTDGFTDGESLSFAIWDASENVEYGRGFGGVSVTYTLVVAESEAFESNAIYVVSDMTASPVVSNETAAPGTFALNSNFPNPFTSQTTIQYELPRESPVTLEVFDMVGRRVAVLVDQVQPAGTHEVAFAAENGISSGIYICSIRAGDFTATRKMTVLG